jgi:hypothetical protein
MSYIFLKPRDSVIAMRFDHQDIASLRTIALEAGFEELGQSTE